MANILLNLKQHTAKQTTQQNNTHTPAYSSWQGCPLHALFFLAEMPSTRKPLLAPESRPECKINNEILMISVKRAGRYIPQDFKTVTKNIKMHSPLSQTHPPTII